MAKAALWNETPKARRTLAGLTAEQVSIEPHAPVVGPKVYVWHLGETGTALEAIRKAEFEAEHGTYADAWNAGRADAYLDAHAACPSVHDVLVGMFGEPPHFGSYLDSLCRQIAKEQVERVLGVARREAA